MQCKWDKCENEARAKSPFCSGTCKKRSQRASGTDEVGQEQSGTQVGQGPEQYGKHQAFEDIQAVGGLLKPRFVHRTEPDKLNWGPWMDMSELKQAGLKGNRVPIPGDHDYQGVCEQLDGGCRVA